jgi:hypothetical protein
MTRRRAVVVLACAGALLAAPAPAPAAGVLWGATISGPPGQGDPPWNWAAQTAFEQRSAGGKRASVAAFGGTLGSDPGFPADPFRIARRHGTIPFFSWSTAGLSDREIAGGAADEAIRRFARGAAAWGHPFFVRLDWEMNGSWFPWGVGNAGTTAADYVAMWRHVHDVAIQAGAVNATWVWCPNVDVEGRLATSLASVFPGRRYVDWTCLDGYNSDDPWWSFRQLFARSYDEITRRLAPGKPLIVAETASTERGGSKPGWIREMFALLPRRFPHIRGLMWFERADPGLFDVSDWTLASSPAASAAFAAGIADRRYVTNRFGRLRGHPIQPPR